MSQLRGRSRITACCCTVLVPLRSMIRSPTLHLNKGESPVVAFAEIAVVCGCTTTPSCSSVHAEGQAYSPTPTQWGTLSWLQMSSSDPVLVHRSALLPAVGVGSPAAGRPVLCSSLVGLRSHPSFFSIQILLFATLTLLLSHSNNLHPTSSPSIPALLQPYLCFFLTSPLMK